MMNHLEMKRARKRSGFLSLWLFKAEVPESPKMNAGEKLVDKNIEEEAKDDKDFAESFNQLELLETHRHLIPTGTQSLWSGDSDEEDQDEKNEEWYQAQEKKLENNPDKLLLWAAEKNRVSIGKCLECS